MPYVLQWNDRTIDWLTHSVCLRLLKQRFGMKVLLDVPLQKLWLNISMCFDCIIQSLFSVMLVSIISYINLHSYCMHHNLYNKKRMYLSFLWFVGVLYYWLLTDFVKKYNPNSSKFVLCVMESVCICVVCHTWTNQALSYDFKIKFCKIVINLQHIGRFVIYCN